MISELIAYGLEGLRPETILQQGGLGLLLLIVFLETGVFFGFFLPSDSLLLTAGLLCGTVYLDVPVTTLILGLTAAGFLGSVAGYAFGHRAGDYLMHKKESLFFKKKYLAAAENYYLRHVQAAFVLGRFLRVVRTFVPILAGVVRSPWGTFVGYNLIGSLLLVSVFVAEGNWLGHLFPTLVRHLEWLVIGLGLLTSAPLVLTWLRQRRRKHATPPPPHHESHA